MSGAASAEVTCASSSSRYRGTDSLSDKVRTMESLMIEGMAQSLDRVRWSMRWRGATDLFRIGTVDESSDGLDDGANNGLLDGRHR